MSGYKCRCIEVSAILNHKVADLLVGMLKQIQGRYDVMTAQSADGDAYDDDDDEACLVSFRVQLVVLYTTIPQFCSCCGKTASSLAWLHE